MTTNRKASRQRNAGSSTHTDSQPIPNEDVHVLEEDSSAGGSEVPVEEAAAPAARSTSTTKKNIKNKKEGDEVTSCVLDSIYKVQCPGRIQDVKVYEVWEGVRGRSIS
ncbi:unnamed protein product [Linum trigynum]|uniref:Uncharacterized protein n=1 Tax=Linum trigynum TaxID=586398 RepID=A0AAV2CT06_9ROSI